MNLLSMRTKLVCRFILVWLTLCFSSVCYADITVIDGMGQKVTLSNPARRIVSLAPHVTENLFSAGAGEYIVGVVQYSDFPPEANKIPRVGGYKSLDLEAIVALQPDLVVAWESGNKQQVEKLAQLGLIIFRSEPRKLLDIPIELENLGKLVGSEDIANKAARAFRVQYSTLKNNYSGQPKVRAFYQVWDQPLMTINGQHLINDVMNLCGVENVFAELHSSNPTIDVEAVLVADPQMITASGMGEARPEWLDDWRRWPQLQAVKRDNLFFIPPSIIQRHTMRILQAAEKLCLQAEEVRNR